ncbi:hypothetical protein OPV22_014520 [Ensete ventricosum]|uniref:DNA-directed RNA polymerase n=1 Tax=Ensete ventricosum TaxID=4639 RepID=A0AAV8PQD2_ENSVE|nr:hypothetical protein OPV22_014520 [Ensete ventricosum]
MVSALSSLEMTDQAASGVVKYVHLNFYTTEEIRKISVKKITKPDLLDAKNSPVPDGLYDPALGPLNDNDSCKSCGQLSVHSPGHCGHIDLAKPLYNPLLFKTLQGLLQITCFFCHKFKINDEKVKRYVAQLDLIVKGDINGARSLEANSWSEIFFPEEETAESITSNFDNADSNHLTWTSLQQSEALSILSKFMKEMRKKCDNCGKKTPTINSPVFGWLNKDHIVSAVLLTKMYTFLTSEEYHQLLYASSVPPTSYSQWNRFGQTVSVSWSDYEIQPLPPAIWKPTPLWTGKQVITAILNFVTRGCLPLTIEKRGRIQKEYIGEDHTLLVLHIHNNELIHGMIDKAQFGTYGLVHAVHELYGPDVAGTLLSVFSRLFTSFLQIHGFTCGVDDLLLNQKSDTERERILKKSEIQSGDVHMRFTRTKDGDGDPMKLQREIEKVLRDIFPNGLMKPFLKNCLSLMTTTGAKGGLVNMTHLFFVGSTRVGRKTRGFISDRFLTGLRPQEYYFHCMAGCDGLVDTAIKTSRSGYLQWCLIKNLECLKVSYDHTVRDADGSVIQFIYGEDGVDVLKMSHISEFKMLLDNQKVVLQKFSGQIGDTSLAKSNAYIRELPCSLRDKATDFVLKNQKSFPHQINQKDFMKLMKLKYLSSLAEPGEAVGVVAAQSILFFRLNTFHLAGKWDMNVTLGIPRLQEILMTASKDIWTPLMNCPLHAWKTKDDAERLAAKLRRVSVADVVERMEVCTVPFSIHGNQISTIYKLKMTLYPSELYPSFSEVTLEDCKEVMKTTFVEAMEDAIAKHLDMIFKISDIKFVSGKEENNFEGVDEDDCRNKSNTVEENVDGGDEDDESLDDQGTDFKRRKQQANDEVEYDDDEDYLMGGGSPGFDMDIATLESPSKADSTAMSEVGKKKSKLEEKGTKKTKSKVDKKAKKPKSSKKKIRRTIYMMVEGLKFEVHYIFRSEPRILLAEIAQRTAKRVYVKEYKNIERCSLKENKKSTDPFMLQIAGVNFNTLWDLEEYLDINHIYSNDIHAMLNTYGVEAARATIIKEVTDVFGLYGIQVNIRHLSLIADFMTFHGGYRPMNRIGMGDFNISPFGKDDI